MPGGNSGEIVGRVGRWGPRAVAKVIRIVFAGNGMYTTLTRISRDVLSLIDKIFDLLSPRRQAYYHGKHASNTT